MRRHLAASLSSLVILNCLITMSTSLISPRGQTARSWTTPSSNSESESFVKDGFNNDEERRLCHLEMKGSSSSSSLDTFFRGGDDSTDRRSKIMALALFTTYFSVMGAKCALPSTFNLLTSKESGLHYLGEPQKSISTMLALSTGAISFGKFLLGPLIDKVGGVACLKVALCTLLVALASIASTTSFTVFAISWILVDFTFSSCWAACLNAIFQSFPEEKWAGQVSSIAVAGRVGNVSAFFLFSSVLEYVQRQGNNSWRPVFIVASLFQAIPLLVFTRLQKVTTGTIGSQNEVRESAPTSMKDTLRVLGRESQTIPFWMHLISRSCLMIIASFLLFVPSYMANAYGMSEGSSARVGALYALGSLLSVSLGTRHFSDSSTRGKKISTVVLLGSLIACSLFQMAHISGAIVMSPLGGALSMFIWGIAFSIPFYIPPSMYALRRGGKKSSATIADAFDFIGFLALAWFNGFVARRQQQVLSSWLLPFGILSGCALTSLISLVIAISTEER